MYRVGIITASDKGSRGERIDESGQKIKDINVNQNSIEIPIHEKLVLIVNAYLNNNKTVTAKVAR